MVEVECGVVNLSEDWLADAELYDAGSDWLTTTCSEHSPTVELRERAYALMERYADEGNMWVKNSRVLGYTGDSCGPVYYGERYDGVIFRASSVASDQALEVTRELAVSTTRVDLQVTLCFPDDRSDIGLRVADASHTRAQEISSTGRLTWRTRRIDGYGAGDSAIVGARSSEAFGRCYDKHREGLEKYRERVGKFVERAGVYPLGSWRFEVEFKKSQANQIYQRLMDGESFHSVAVAHVVQWYSDHGIMLPCRPGDASPVRTVKHRPDVQRSLAWLATAVHPTIEKLIDMGYRDEVYKVLGLGTLDRCCCGASATWCLRCASQLGGF